VVSAHPSFARARAVLTQALEALLDLILNRARLKAVPFEQ
jgi:hypothetical protein